MKTYDLVTSFRVKVMDQSDCYPASRGFLDLSVRYEAKETLGLKCSRVIKEAGSNYCSQLNLRSFWSETEDSWRIQNGNYLFLLPVLYDMYLALSQNIAALRIHPELESYVSWGWMTMTGNKKHTLASSARSLSSFCSTSTSLF
jgi:hypothetical protein